MSKEEILLYFKDINQAYNNASMYDSLSKLLDEYAEEVRADAIDEVIKGLKEESTKQNNPHSKYIRTIVANEGIFDALEQMKEQTNDIH